MANIVHTSRGILVSIERWREITQVMLDTAGKASLAPEFMIERCDDFDGDPDLENVGPEDDGIPMTLAMTAVPSCKISDPPEDDDPAGSEHDDRVPKDGV